MKLYTVNRNNETKSLDYDAPFLQKFKKSFNEAL